MFSDEFFLDGWLNVFKFYTYLFQDEKFTFFNTKSGCLWDEGLLILTIFS